MKLINGWTKEKVMEQVRKYNNGRRAVSKQDACQYLTEDGNRCAVGCFIPDGHRGLEHMGYAEGLLKDFPDLKKVMPFESYDLEAFQIAHDKSSESRGVYKSIEQFLNDNVTE